MSDPLSNVRPALRRSLAWATSVSLAALSQACPDSTASGGRLQEAEAATLTLELLDPTGDPAVVRQGGEAVFRLLANRSGDVSLEVGTPEGSPIELPAVSVTEGAPTEM